MGTLNTLAFIPSPRLQGYVRKLLMPLGFDFYLAMDDRRVLETIILPFFSRDPQYRRVLFLGCDWYTRGYRKFFPARSYWTLDANPQQARHGARLHVTDVAQNVGRHFEPEMLDLIICNGVYGWGLDELADFETVIAGCHAALRQGGVFLLGWDDNARRRPFPLEQSRTLAQFQRFVFPPLATEHYLTANPGRHTFDFYIKA